MVIAEQIQHKYTEKVCIPILGYAFSRWYLYLIYFRTKYTLPFLFLFPFCSVIFKSTIFSFFTFNYLYSRITSFLYPIDFFFIQKMVFIRDIQQNRSYL